MEVSICWYKKLAKPSRRFGGFCREGEGGEAQCLWIWLARSNLNEAGQKQYMIVQWRTGFLRCPAIIAVEVDIGH